MAKLRSCLPIAAGEQQRRRMSRLVQNWKANLAFVSRWRDKARRTYCATPREALQRFAKNWGRSKKKRAAIAAILQHGELTTEELCKAVGWKVRTCMDGTRRYSSYETRMLLVYMKVLAKGRRGRLTTYTLGGRFDELQKLGCALD